jgi:hypothetical protein
VPMMSVLDFNEHLKALGIPSQLVTVLRGGYSWEGDIRFKRPQISSPNREQIAILLADFFDLYLK